MRRSISCWYARSVRRGSPSLLRELLLTETPHTVVNRRVVEELGLSPGAIMSAADREIEEIERRRQRWLAGRKPISVSRRTTIVVDDGIATGSSIRAGLEALRDRGAARLVVAAPVAPAETAQALRKLCDDAVFLLEPDDFLSVGGYYADFHQIEDEEMVRYLERARVALSEDIARSVL
jgi:putative phosphoribosyl transferase